MNGRKQLKWLLKTIMPMHLLGMEIIIREAAEIKIKVNGRMVVKVRDGKSQSPTQMNEVVVEETQ